MTLDWLAERQPLPDVLKIDVEGAELEVLQGARELLKRKRPVVLCEVGAESVHDVTAIFHAMGYQLFDGQAAKEQRRPLQYATWSTIALPS